MGLRDLCNLFYLRFKLRNSIGKCFVLFEECLGLGIDLGVPVRVVFPPVDADFAGFIDGGN